MTSLLELQNATWSARSQDYDRLKADIQACRKQLDALMLIEARDGRSSVVLDIRHLNTCESLAVARHLARDLVKEGFGAKIELDALRVNWTKAGK